MKVAGVRLLVTNGRCAQAYAIIRALRPHAERIVATMSGPRPLGVWPTCHAAYSRLVDRRYRVPDPESDWFEGRVGRHNTEREQAFVTAVLEICERERIDTIFPSNDPWVYVFSKNRQVFAEQGIVIPVPDYDTVCRPLDKYLTIQCAQEAGFPCPRTYLPQDDEDVTRIAGELEPPWVVKLRFTTGGRGFAIVHRVADLEEKTRALRRTHGAPIIQEFIPGHRMQSFYLVLDRGGQVVSAQSPRSLRAERRTSHTISTAFETASRHPSTNEAIRLVRHIGWWGGATVQTKIDARDGTPKLMEINPRLGVHLWLRTELGINEPLMCVKIARGEGVEPVGEFPAGCRLLKPIEDAVALGFDLIDLGVQRLRNGLGRSPVDSANPPMTLKELITFYRAPYLDRQETRFSPYFRYCLQDPLPSLIWSSKILADNARLTIKGVGR